MNVKDKNSLRVGPAYMLRNDGEIFDAGKYHPYINYNVTQEGGEWLILEENGKFSFWWQWFYEHTKNEKVKELVIKCIKLLYSLEMSTDIGVELPDNYVDVYSYFGISHNDFIEDVVVEDFTKEANELNELINQEFLRFRIGGYMRPKKGSEDEAYFRISSRGFNWFDLIWTLVYNNQNIIDKITVTKDEQALETSETIKIKGDMLLHYPVKDFLELPGRPIIEKLEKLRNKRIFVSQRRI